VRLNRLTVVDRLVQKQAMYEKPLWASKKLFIAIALETLATWLLYVGKIQADNWETVTMAVAGAYLVSQAYVDKGKRDG